MMTPDELNAILERITQHQQTEKDLEMLRRSLRLADSVVQWVSQDGKFNTNVGQITGGEVHIGDHTYHGVDAEAIRGILHETLKSLQPNTQPTEIPANLPYSGVVTFVGRERELEVLHQQLQQNERVARSAIAGMGGVGKTELALQYALNHKQSYSGGVCWLQVRGVDVGTQLVEFAQVHLGLSIPFNELRKLEQQVIWCWRNWGSPEEPVLIVMDDVTDYEEIKSYLPPFAEPRFKVLITTRLLDLGASIKTLQLDLLTPEAALELLESLIGKDRVEQEYDGAKNLCRWLGYLPLGLELVGRYLRQRSDLNLDQMLQRLENERLEQRALQKRAKDMTAPLNLVAAFELSWQMLDESAQRLACLLGLFTSFPFFWFLVEECFPDESTETLEDLRDESLINLSLLYRVDEGVYQIHQLLRDFLNAKLSAFNGADDLRHSFCKIMTALAARIPEFPTREQITLFALLVPHITEAVTVLEDWLDNEYLNLPFHGLGNFYKAQGSYQEAIPLLEQCLSLVQERLGENHIRTAVSLNNLALLYCEVDRYEEAEAFSHQALEIVRRLEREEDVIVSRLEVAIFNVLAQVYCSQKFFEEAETLYQRALEISEHSGEEEHLEKDIYLGDSVGLKGMCLDNLASLYRQQGRYEKAETLGQQALQLIKQQLGDEHPHVAICLDNLALLYRQQGRYEEAEAFGQQALQLMKQQIGDEHPDVLICLKGLAGLSFSQHRFEEAEQLCRQVLETKKRLYGEQHPDIVVCLCNIARACYYQNRHEAAEQSYQQALELSKCVFGEKHPNTLECIEGLFSLYRSQRRFEEAEQLYQKILELKKHLYGEQHSDVAECLQGIAVLCCYQNRFEKAEQYYQQALELGRHIFGENHPFIIKCLEDLLSLHRTQHQFEKAEKVGHQILEVRKELEGEEHLSVATDLLNLSALCGKLQGRYEEAEALLRQALAIAERLKHYQLIAVCLSELAWLQKAQDHYQEAEQLYRQMLQLREHLQEEKYPSVNQCLDELAEVCHLQSRYDEAESLYKESLELKKRLYGEEHPDVALSLDNFAGFYKKQKRYSEAEPLYQKALAILQQTLEKNHPYVGKVMSNLGTLYATQGHDTVAEPLYVEALEILEQGLGADHPWTVRCRENFAQLRNRS
jgi:tetratricopeptide (TPR) repeat protein